MPNCGEGEGQRRGNVERLIADGAEIAGGAVTGALGFLAAGPTGAVVLGAAGTMASIALKHIGQEACSRLLSPREKVRAGAVIAIAAAHIKERLERGESLRSDGFFDAKPSGRSDAVEVAESVLLKSQREPEEKKIAYMGHLLANVAFDPAISTQMAHQLSKAAEQLTYRQLCILRLAVVKQRFRLRTVDYRGQESFTKELYQVLYECLVLYNNAFVNFGGAVLFGPTDVAPGKMELQGLGADLYNLMGLAMIPDEDLTQLTAQLRQSA
jgi:hypothetical protein